MRGKRSDIMNEVIKNILGRRSVRKFIEKEIPKGDLEQIVTAGIHAPSGMNKQLWHFSVVQDKKLIRKMAKAIGDILGRDGYDFYRPDTLILVSNDRDNPHGAARQRLCSRKYVFGGTFSRNRLGVDQSVLRNMRRQSASSPARRGKGTVKSHYIRRCGLGYAEHPYNDSHRDTDGKIDFVL